VSDDEQPLLFVTVRVGMNVPEVAYAFVGFIVDDDVASPKFQLYDDNDVLDTVKLIGRPAIDG
jgi:hypothetical protein